MKNLAVQSSIYFNGKIITMDDHDQIAESIMVIDDKIIAVGRNEEIKGLKLPDTEMINLEGKVMMPGLIDGHLHLEVSVTDTILGHRALTPPCNTIDSILDQIKKAAKKTPLGEWVVVRGTIGYENKIADKRQLTRKDIDAVVDTHPVAFFPAVHTCILNSKGIEKMGWFHEKHMPINATLGRDPKTGELTGIFCEVMETAPLSPWGYEERKNALYQGTLDYFVSKGVTSVHELPYSFDGIRAWQELKSEDRIPLRITMFLPDVFLLHGAEEFLQYGLSRGFGDNWIKLGGIKFFADGSKIHANGHPVKCLHYTQGELDELVYKCHVAGWQIWAHALTEEGFLQVLTAYENALKKHPKQDHRMRIEHSGDIIGNCERCDEYVKRMLDAQICPMLTPHFQYGAAYFNPNSKIHTKGLIDRGFRLPGNSDSTGSTPAGFNPWFNIWCAVTRKNYAGQVIGESERISVIDALKMFTKWAAWGAFEENIKGTIEPGKLADLIILGDDPLTCDPDALKDMPVEEVIIGGKKRI